MQQCHRCTWLSRVDHMHGNVPLTKQIQNKQSRLIGFVLAQQLLVRCRVHMTAGPAETLYSFTSPPDCVHHACSDLFGSSSSTSAKDKRCAGDLPRCEWTSVWHVLPVSIRGCRSCLWKSRHICPCQREPYGCKCISDRSSDTRTFGSDGKHSTVDSRTIRDFELEHSITCSSRRKQFSVVASQHTSHCRYLTHVISTSRWCLNYSHKHPHLNAYSDADLDNQSSTNLEYHTDRQRWCRCAADPDSNN